MSPSSSSNLNSRKIVFLFLSLLSILDSGWAAPLRFKKDGKFKILQVADMHYANGNFTACIDVKPSQRHSCSDLNTTAFLQRIILAESPDLIVFTGDNIHGHATADPERSMDAAFAPAIASNIPWTAILGNHDQESFLSRQQVMTYITGLQNTLAQLNPIDMELVDGFGNHNLEVFGAEGSEFHNKSILNLFLLDSGDYSTVPSVPGYGWIKASQQYWFQCTSMRLRQSYMNTPNPQTSPAPGLVYFHMPLPEYATSHHSTGVKQEKISAASINSGFFTTMMESGDVKAAFIGHDHVNDFCGERTGIHLCYAGGFGYRANGKAGWSRRARVVEVDLEKLDNGSWGIVSSIRTWKRLDDVKMREIDEQTLWPKSDVGRHGGDSWRGRCYVGALFMLIYSLTDFRIGLPFRKC